MPKPSSAQALLSFTDYNTQPSYRTYNNTIAPRPAWTTVYTRYVEPTKGNYFLSFIQFCLLKGCLSKTKPR